MPVTASIPLLIAGLKHRALFTAFTAWNGRFKLNKRALRMIRSKLSVRLMGALAASFQAWCDSAAEQARPRYC